MFNLGTIDVHQPCELLARKIVHLLYHYQMHVMSTIQLYSWIRNQHNCKYQLINSQITCLSDQSQIILCRKYTNIIFRFYLFKNFPVVEKKSKSHRYFRIDDIRSEICIECVRTYCNAVKTKLGT